MNKCVKAIIRSILSMTNQLKRNLSMVFYFILNLNGYHKSPINSFHLC